MKPRRVPDPPKPRICAIPGCDNAVLTSYRSRKYCSAECSLKAMHLPRRKRIVDEVRHCEREGCGAEMHRPNHQSAANFKARRFCSRECAMVVIGKERTKRVQMAAGAAMIVRPWRIYRDDKPTIAAVTLAEAKAKAGLGKPRYIEIANIETGQHLMRFLGKWVETKPEGSQFLALKDIAA
jgi:hypothetical protein